MIQLIDYQTDIIKVLVIFYLLIYSAQIDKIFTCLKINKISNNVTIQYIIIFFIFFFLVSSISNTTNLINIEPIQKLIYSIIYFILFIFTLRIDANIRDIILILLIISFFINMNYDHYSKLLENNNNNKYYWITWKYPEINMFPVNLYQVNLINKLNSYLIYIIYILFIIAFIIYIKRVIYLLKKKINWYNIIFHNFCNNKNIKL
jgi:hypothetical protein